MPTLTETLYYSFYDLFFPPPEAGKQWRDRATAEAYLRSRALEQSQAAWAAGNKEESKRLSELGKAHGAKMEHFNKLASKSIFTHHNDSSKSSTFSNIDLHGLFVNEALERAQAHLTACRKAQIKTTSFITGRGNRSTDGVPKIKIAILGMLKREGVDVDGTNTNEGAVVAILGDGVDNGLSSDTLIPTAASVLSNVGWIIGWAVRGTTDALTSLVSMSSQSTRNSPPLHGTRAQHPPSSTDAADDDWEIVPPPPRTRQPRAKRAARSTPTDVVM